MIKYDTKAVGKSKGSEGPYINVMKAMFMINENLKCTKYSGPE